MSGYAWKQKHFNSMPTLKFVKTNANAKLPEYKHLGDSGMDVTSVQNIKISPNKRALIKTGLKVEIPDGFEIQVRPRSGLALNNGITVLNSPGTIDSRFRGEIGVILINSSDEEFSIQVGDRIAQLVICPVIRMDIEEVSEISNSTRGEGGFGSTGIK
jgi:dUTP pyrophosphatase